jgi:hypothetical protein
MIYCANHQPTSAPDDGGFGMAAYICATREEVPMLGLPPDMIVEIKTPPELECGGNANTNPERSTWYAGDPETGASGSEIYTCFIYSGHYGVIDYWGAVVGWTYYFRFKLTHNSNIVISDGIYSFTADSEYGTLTPPTAISVPSGGWADIEVEVMECGG